MKLVHVETGQHLYGGAQQVAYLLEGLTARGIDNLLVCPPGAAIGAHFAGSAVKVVELRCGGDADLGFVPRLARVLREQQPDLVHLHSRRGADVLGGVAAKIAGIPALLSRRVDNAENPWWARRKYRLYARIICISEGIAAVLRGEGVDAGRIRVVRSAVQAAPWRRPESREAFCAEFNVDRDALIIGVVAQLIERKGHRVLFEALRGLQTTHKLALVIFGQGALRAALESEAASLPLPVRFAGFRADLPRWLGCLDLLVHPALMEGLGVSLLQASAASVAIIASRAGGMPEAIRDGLNGLLVAPGDSAALGLAIGRLASDAGLRHELGAAGARLIDAEFSTAAMIEGNLAVYRELTP
ncbi:MAG: glycosyl transferase group 1 family protein [Hydrocarboniphaga sp.]|uniref:glycosyltransferase n=1 Tax=Hydrocarboniphaga sp. TaxID=2033016 RepID=UPI00262D464F|nr:glycosyltransferase [Hydrocarboniphaga sp.]MDB5969473.1 glycosyl transferase group 1 family protein [Hydrocarboniphaga sp.]